ncbi:hypothetical protein CBOM_07504 [Ceraceosorus bombacis]|uniref:Uncharacterized protein n=1 Tax=Ceraceosorus bombacis TaxID=401625 RepID=A0A0P1BER0_9BASI|nr:hypothetical protein CBOM_07504 [Ceraceosorus bombacis]
MRIALDRTRSAFSLLSHCSSARSQERRQEGSPASGMQPHRSQRPTTHILLLTSLPNGIKSSFAFKQRPDHPLHCPQSTLPSQSLTTTVRCSTSSFTQTTHSTEVIGSLPRH